MYSRKSLGPRMEPWGTPVLTGYSCEDFPSITTWGCLLLRKEEIRPNIWNVTLDIPEDLLKAEIYGKEMKDKFIKERLKIKVKNIWKCRQKVMVKTSDKRLIKYKQQGNLAFQFLIQTQCLGEKENMKLLMSFPLTPVPLSIGTSDGMLLKKK